MVGHNIRYLQSLDAGRVPRHTSGFDFLLGYSLATKFNIRSYDDFPSIDIFSSTVSFLYIMLHKM